MERSITLSAGDLDAVLDLAREADRMVPTETAIHDVLAALSRLIPCDLVFWTRVDVQTPLKIAEIGFPRAPRAMALDEWIAHRHEHPICSGAYGPVVAISDVIDPARLHSTWLYEHGWREAGWEYEMGVNLTHPYGEIHDIVFSRGPGPDFDERDHLVLRLLFPHLDAALRKLAFPTVRLTPRETEVLRCVREGMTTRLIAKELGVAECTVVKHLEHVYARVGAHSRAQALQLCATALS